MTRTEFLKTSAMAGSQIDRPLSPEIGKRDIVVVTDLEGPHLLGDTALEVMRKSLGSYGLKIYEETYNWFEREVKDKEDLAQEASDIVLTLPLLLHQGCTDVIMQEVARESKRTPGSAELVNYLKKNNALIIGVTTAWEPPHKDIVEKIGFNGIVGTHFSLDKVRNYMIENGCFEKEMEVVNRFLKEAVNLIDANDIIGLQQRIGRFYQEELGVTWGSQERKRKKTTKRHKTKLGQIIESIDVIGDLRKASAARLIFNQFSSTGGLQITIGDGFNDCKMLELAPNSIAVNGADAAKSAKIGVVTDNMIIVAQIIDLMRRYPTVGMEQIVEYAQYIVGNQAIIHKGGKDVPEDILDKHRKMKRKIRGSGAIIP